MSKKLEETNNSPRLWSETCFEEVMTRDCNIGPKVQYRCYNLKKRPPPQPRIEITTVGDLYTYLEAEKLRYVRAKFHHERLNEKRMLYVLKEKPFHFDFR
ncbi:hypothetical protein TNCV_604571 [Trichonephila clavipes]|nr:hypothetical protein TNCV_604571 [Trichonephila clavipes]